MTAPKRVGDGDGSMTVFGDPADPYFQHAEVHLAGLAPLGRFATRHARRDGLILDVGANIGLSSILLARACPAATVLAFDPSPVNAAFLRRNAEANGAGNIQVVEAAVSDGPGRLRVHLEGAWTHVVGRGHMLPGLPSVEVPVTTIDAAARGRGRVDLVKVDTEGYEPHVLAGARAVLERDRPPVLIEFHSWCLTGVAGISPAAFAGALWECFEVGRLSHDGGVVAADGSAHDFLHANMTRNGLVEDLLIRLRDGAAAPTLERMSLPGPYAAELERLRAETAALRRSTSWRLTAPLRRVADGLRGRR